MPAILANARNFLINTDYPMDKVIYLKEQSLTMGDSIDVSIAHGLPFIPLVWFQWSLTSDFAIAYENNTGPFPSGIPGYLFALLVMIEANATNIILRGNGTTSSITIYVRIFGFQPSTSNVDLAPTSSQADNFILNTDYNYMKLITATSVAVNAGVTNTITHGYGYIPHILLWDESSGTIRPVNLSRTSGGIPVEVTANQIIIINDSASNVIMHYRLYIDE